MTVLVDEVKLKKMTVVVLTSNVMTMTIYMWLRSTV